MVVVGFGIGHGVACAFEFGLGVAEISDTEIEFECVRDTMADARSNCDC